MTTESIIKRRDGSFAVAEQLSRRHDAGEKLTAHEQHRWQRALDDVELAGRELEAQGVPRTATLADVQIDEQARREAAGAAGPGNHPDAVHVPGSDPEAFRSYVRTGDDRELRALGTTVGDEGGYMVPTGFRNTVTETLAAFGGVRSLAEVIPTSSGNDLPWPTNDDTANAGHILNENTADDEQDASFGQKTLGAYTYTSKIVRVSRQLFQDSTVPIETWLARKLAQRIGRAQAPHFITGTGSSQPQGLLTGLSVGKTATATTAITYGELVDVAHSVDAAYREGAEMAAGNGAPADGVAWAMNDLTLAYILKLEDDQGRPLVQPDLQRGGRVSLLGYPIRIDNSMPTIQASAKPIIFGNIRAAYVIRDVQTMQVLRMDERYGERLQVGFLGWWRTDAAVQDASAAKVLQMAAT